MPDAFTGSPPSAYRADMAGRTAPFGADDDAWLAAASELHLAATAPLASRQKHLHESIGIGIDLLGDAGIDAIADREWREERSYVDPLIVLADLVHQSGALRLAAVLLDDLASAATDISTVQRGRILTLRARMDWKLGRLDEALDRYRYIASLGKSAKSSELEARAEIGFAVIAQLRGNYPEMVLHDRRATELADRDGHAGIARVAHHGLMIGAARAGEFDDALLHGWRVLELSKGDAVLEAESLQNIGQLLLEAGHHTAARASFAAIVRRAAPPRILLPALGGLALASARLGSEPTVEWCVREVWRAQGSTVPRYELAAALVECAVALLSFRREADSRQYAAAAAAIVDANGFHELAFRIAELEKSKAVPLVTRVAFRPDAARVARELEDSAPEQLPVHVQFEPAPA